MFFRYIYTPYFNVFYINIANLVNNIDSLYFILDILIRRKTQMKNYSNITFTVPHELAEWLKEYKKRHFVSLSAVITKLIQDWRETLDV